MDQECRWNYQVPTFGKWDYYENDKLEYTQCFENARQVGSLVRNNTQVEDKDLYVAGDLYQNDVVTPAVILVPRRRCRMERKGECGGYPNVKGGKKQEDDDMQKQEWGGYSYEYDIKVFKSKPIDQDLYQIPHEYIHVKPKRKKGFGLFSSCLQPNCV